MRLKNIAVSETNYEILRNVGKTGTSFNDVISDLITRVHTAESPDLNDNDKK